MKNFLTSFKKSVSTKELLFALLFGIVIILFLEIPYFYGTYISSSSAHYTHLLNASPADYIIYYNLIEQSKNGAFLFQNFFTSEPHAGVYFSPLWLLLGKIASVNNLESHTIFELAKIVSGLLCILMLYCFIAYFFKNKKHRKIALVVTTLSAGISFFALPYITYISQNIPIRQGLFYPIDMVISEAFTFSILSHSALFSLSLTLMLSIFWLFLRRTESFWGYFFLGTSAATLGLMHIYDLITITVVATLYVLFTFIVKKRLHLQYVYRLLLIFFVFAVCASYFYILFNTDPVLGGWAMQNKVITSYLFPTLIGFGALIPLALYGSYRAAKTSNYRLIFLAFWAIPCFILAFSPLPFQRKLFQGISVPLGILSTYAIIALYQKSGIFKRKTAATIYQGVLLSVLSIALFLTPLYITFFQIHDFSKKEFAYFLNKNEQDVFTYLEKNVRDSEHILASPGYDQLIPGIIFKRVYSGNDHQTINYAKKEQEIFAFWTFQNNIPWKKQFLIDGSIEYLLIEKAADKYHRFDFDSVDFVKKVFENEQFVVYKTKISPTKPHTALPPHSPQVS